MPSPGAPAATRAFDLMQVMRDIEEIGRRMCHIDNQETREGCAV